MKTFQHLTLAALFLVVCLLCGCQGSKPLSPSRVMFLNVFIPPTNELRSSLLGAGSNELLYRVEGPGMTTMKATLGPFSTAASSGSIDFTLMLPGGNKRLLSLQLNDGGTHQPLAIGAAQIDFTSASPVSNIVVEMGSVTRTCYYTYNTSFSGNYGFAADAIGNTWTAVMDISYNAAPGISVPATLYDPNAVPVSTIAYLGNGNFVDFDYVPPDSNFNTTSAIAKTSGPLQVGDIFCIKLNSITGGHAWIQITYPGNGAMYNGPYFRFRINSTAPYYAYDRTTADVANACSTMW